jgi:AcrR family transcriptional regulator
MVLVEAIGMRQRIVQEATRLFTHNGYNAVSMREIAAACGITKAALYYHFRDKQDLFVAILSEYLERMNRLIDECRAAAPTSRERLSVFVQAVFQQPAEQRAIIRLASQEMPNLSPEFRNAFDQQYHAQFIGKLADLLKEGMQAQELRPANEQQATWVLLGMMYPFFYPHENRPVELESITGLIISVFFEGMSRHD